jgi:AmmeMemoRadiSam system protein B/AmmeMemoRadiSam system protein A
MTTTRPAAVAGSFYPAAPQALRAALADHLGAAAAAPPRPARPKMLLVPHAGYRYSGDVAALAYAPLARWRGQVRRVVLLGPTHRVALRGLAAPTVDAFATPLGRVPLDHDALAGLADLSQVVRTDLPHVDEHSLEVQLPFLQAVLGDGFTLVPLAVGAASAAEVAEVLERLWGGDETLIVVSSDLSHYLAYEEAQSRDRATVKHIMALESDLHGHQACGAAPLNGALRLARRHGLQPRLLGLRNSADAAGMTGADRDRVVGYAAIAFEPPAAVGIDDAEADTDSDADDDSPTLGHALLASARQTIAAALGLAEAAGAAPPDHPALQRPGATFVTLHGADGRLRGCIGRLEAVRPLGDDVRANARAAAFDDPRFAPLRADEWPGLKIEVSLLGATQPLAARSEAEALRALRPGIDGVILEWRGYRATLLPQVWSQLPDAAEFVGVLKQKAGLAADFWAHDIRLSCYQVRYFSESRPEGVFA